MFMYRYQGALWRPFICLFAVLASPSLQAHSFGRPYQLPMPYWLYIYGAMAALALSFLVLAYFLTVARSEQPQKLVPLSQTWLERLKQWRVQGVLAAVLGVGFLFSVLTGLMGSADPYRNWNMTFFWIIFCLGGVYLSALAGDWYTRLNPWRWLSLGLGRWWPRFRDGRFTYPASWHYWPALLLYLGFIGLELFGDVRPFSLSLYLIAYAVINVLACYLFGMAAWFRYGELFSVMMRLVAMMSPLYIRPPGGTGPAIAWRWPLSGLIGQRVEHISLLLFLLFMLSSTAFDGLRETKAWFGLFWEDPLNIVTPLVGEHPLYAFVQLRPWYIAYEILVMCLSPFLYLALFHCFLWLGKCLVRSDITLSELGLRFGYSLLPIAVVYHITHYYTLLLSQGVKVQALVSDPFGWGWNLFGTAITGRVPWLLDMGFIWDSQVWLILVGHVASVYLAHIEALRSFKTAKAASISQLPMLLLMCLFTGAGLWILAQPLQG